VPNDTNRREDVFQATVDLNRSPEAADDSATTLQETLVDINVLANDTDPDGDELAVGEVGVAAHGTTSINPDGTVRYLPDDGFSGLDTFTYTVTDSHGGTDMATVSVNVTSLNQPPSVDAGPDQTITFPTDTVILTGIVSDDGLPSGSILTISWSQVDGPAAVEFGTPDELASRNGRYARLLHAQGTRVVRGASEQCQLLGRSATTPDSRAPAGPSVLEGAFKGRVEPVPRRFQHKVCEG